MFVIFEGTRGRTVGRYLLRQQVDAPVCDCLTTHCIKQVMYFVWCVQYVSKDAYLMANLSHEAVQSGLCLLTCLDHGMWVGACQRHI